MIKQEFIKRSPIRILEQSIHGGLGRGNLGVFVAKKGVGKTACLVHFATDRLLRGQKALHISFSDNPHHIATWYQQVYTEVATAYKLEDSTAIFDELLRHRLILHFKEQDVTLEAVGKNIDIYVKDGGFRPEVIIVDGYPFRNISEKELQKWQALAKSYDAEIWFSATLPSTNLTVGEFIQPFKSYFSVVIELHSQSDHIEFKLVKDHDAMTSEKLLVKLDPKTLLIANRRI